MIRKYEKYKINQMNDIMVKHSKMKLINIIWMKRLNILIHSKSHTKFVEIHHHTIIFIEFYFFNPWWRESFIDFYIHLTIQCDYHPYFNWFGSLCCFYNLSMQSKWLFCSFYLVFGDCFLTNCFWMKMKVILYSTKISQW